MLPASVCCHLVLKVQITDNCKEVETALHVLSNKSSRHESVSVFVCLKWTHSICSNSVFLSDFLLLKKSLENANICVRL